MIDLKKLTDEAHLSKLFDGSTIPQDKIDTLLSVLRSAPSSLNVQATHYVVAASQAARERIAKAVQGGFELNNAKIATASHVIVFCTRMSLPTSHMDTVAAQEHADGRFPNADLEMRWRDLVAGALAAREFDFKDLSHWLEKQTYLALGIALMTAAELDLNALSMEGFNPRVLDAELGIREKGYTSTVLLALGRQSPDDYIINTPKSRLPMKQYFTLLG